MSRTFTFHARRCGKRCGRSGKSLYTAYAKSVTSIATRAIRFTEDDVSSTLTHELADINLTTEGDKLTSAAILRTWDRWLMM